MIKGISSFTSNKHTRNSNGFTIIELMVAIVIIAIIATITVISYSGTPAKAENTKTLHGVQQYISVLTMHKHRNGDYPTHGTQLACLGTDYESGACLTATNGTTPAASVNTEFNQSLLAISSPLAQPSKKIYTLSNGSRVAGASFDYNTRIIRYYLAGDNQECEAGGTGTNMGGVTQCSITLE